MQTMQLALLMLTLSMSTAAQTTSQPDTAPAPAFGQNAPVLNPENPPISGVDEPSLELRTATRSFVSPGLQLSETADTNANNTLGPSSDVSSISRILGAFDLQKFWPKSDLFLEYVGGGAVYANPNDIRQMHSAGFEGVTRWRTGQLALRDSFSYLPDGAFNLGFGGLPGFGIATGSDMTGVVPGTRTLNGGTLGSVGDIPRLANTAILDAVQAINPVSAVTVMGAFSNAHFYDPTTALINSDQLTIEGGYSRLLNRHDQIGVVYAFQLFQFPQATGGQIYSHILNVRYSHTITGRLSFLGGIGPEYTELQQGGYLTNWSISARAQLRYKFARASMIAGYEKFMSPGSGFFAGANTQVASLVYDRPLGRTWEFYGDLSYSYNKKLQDLPGLGLSNASSYNEGSVIAVFRKHLGRTYDFFTAYRFSDVGFNVPGNAQNCIANSCGNVSQRQSGTIGVEWHPTPTRIE